VWGNSGVLLSAPLANGIFYRVVPDGEAGAIVLWGASSGSYVQRVNFLGSKVWGFSGVEYAPGNPASATASKVGSHYGIHDLLPLAGGALIAFRKTGTLDFDIFIQKVDPSGVIQWGANGVTVCNAAGLQFNPLIVSDTESGAIIAWVDDRIGTRSIYAQRVNFLGTPLWTANGVLICTATGNRGQLVMVSDDAGGAVIGWVDLRNAWQDVYAQRVDASGVPQWTTNGEPVAVLASNQTALSMAGNDQGGAYLAWTDTRLPQTEDIEVFGQLMDFDGIARWGANGLRLTNESAGLLTSPSTYAARDGAGGVIVAYTTLGTSRGVRVLNADTAGTVLWDLAPTDPSIPSHKPVIVEADAGGAIVAWEDLRGVGPRSVYAQKLPMAPTATTGMPASSGLDLSLFPNPFSNETQIRFVLPTASDVRVDVHDVRGRRVASRHYDKLASGEQSIELDWRGHHGAALSSGLYFVRVSAAGRSATRKLVVAN